MCIRDRCGWGRRRPTDLQRLGRGATLPRFDLPQTPPLPQSTPALSPKTPTNPSDEAHIPSCRNTLEKVGLIIAREAKTDEPFAVGVLGYLFQQRNASIVTFDQLIIRRQNRRYLVLNLDSGHTKRNPPHNSLVQSRHRRTEGAHGLHPVFVPRSAEVVGKKPEGYLFALQAKPH